MVRKGVRSEPLDGTSADPPKATHPLALVAAGAASLVTFAAAGWMLRGLREGERSRPLPLPASTARVAGVAEPGPQTRGRLVFQVHCARCHGPEGHGDGPDAATLRPPPRDLTVEPWRTAATQDAVRRAVTEGIPGTMMTGLAAALSPRELDAIVDFVLSIAPDGAKGTRVPRVGADLLRRAGFTPASTGRTAPPLVARGAGGEAVSLDRLRGKLVLLVFWGTSCAPCLEELPDLEALAGRFRGGGLEVLLVCVDEADATVARRVAADRAPRLPVFIDPSGAARLSYDVQALPAAALVAPDGGLLGHSVGTMNWSAPAMDAVIRASFAEAVPSTD